MTHHPTGVIETAERIIGQESGQYIPVGWCQELSTGKKIFHEGDLDPREIHDNGRPCYRIFRLLDSGGTE